MAKLFLTSTASSSKDHYSRRDLERLLHYASLDQVKRHSICDSPEAADIVVFAGSSQPGFLDIKASSTFQQHRHKSVIFYSGDKSIPILPGVYTCLEKHPLIPKRHSASAGYYLRVTDNNSLDNSKPVDDAGLLFSFIGNANNHPVRKKICTLEDTRALIRDSSGDPQQQADGVHGANKSRGLYYRDLLHDSKFILCPRGIGVSSWRLFEAMRAGRAPVIISDRWTPPPGPEWQACSIRIQENKIQLIPEILRMHEHKATELGQHARQEWERFFSPGRVFHSLAEQLIAMQRAIRQDSLLQKLLIHTLYLDPSYTRLWLLSPIKTTFSHHRRNLS